jgi:hypothetical protein
MSPTRASRPRPIVFPLAAGAAAIAIAATAVCGCNDAPTTAVIENGYAIASDAGAGASPVAITVFKAWWATTSFPFPVTPAASSETERTIPGSDFAYALLAPGWSPDDGGAPDRLIAIKSIQKLSVAAHQRLRITVSDQQFAGNCAAGSSLAADDAELVVERIFPGAFAGVTYDPVTCTSTPLAPRTSADASAGADVAVDVANDADTNADADTDVAAD